jgi:hypothetical protein
MAEQDQGRSGIWTALSGARSQHLRFEQLEGYVDHRLDPTEAELVEAHTDLCSQCAGELGDLEAFRQALQGEGTSELDGLPWWERTHSRPFEQYAPMPGSSAPSPAASQKEPDRPAFWVRVGEWFKAPRHVLAMAGATAAAVLLIFVLPHTVEHVGSRPPENLTASAPSNAPSQPQAVDKVAPAPPAPKVASATPGLNQVAPASPVSPAPGVAPPTMIAGASRGSQSDGAGSPEAAGAASFEAAVPREEAVLEAPPQPVGAVGAKQLAPRYRVLSLQEAMAYRMELMNAQNDPEARAAIDLKFALYGEAEKEYLKMEAVGGAEAERGKVLMARLEKLRGR